MFSKKTISIFLLTITVAATAIFSHYAFAAIAGEGLTISPPIRELNLKPGESATETIRLTNPTDKLVEVYPKVMNFGAKGEGGEPSFSEATDESAKFSLAKWIEATQSKLALTPEQVVEFKYRITIPENAEPGGHYGVVFFATDPPKPTDDSSKVSIGSMIGSLVMVKVPGQIIEKGLLEEFSTNRNLYFGNKIDFVTKISNLGNVHFKPKGDITIKGINSDEKIVVNEQNSNVLPDSTRKFDNSWQPKGLFVGRYVANLALTYGDSEKTIIGQAVFWIIPWWIIAIALAIITLVIVLIIWGKRKKGKRKSNRMPPRTPGNNINQIILR